MPGWFNHDDDNDSKSSKTDIRDDGTVHRYDGTDNNLSNGHGHEVYSSMDQYVDSTAQSIMDSYDNEPSNTGGDVYSRSPYDSSSIDRDWDDKD